MMETPTKFRLRFKKGDVFNLATRHSGMRPVMFHRYSTNGFICFDSFGTVYKCHTIGHWGEFETHVGQRVHTMPRYLTIQAYNNAVDRCSGDEIHRLKAEMHCLTQDCNDADKLRATIALLKGES